MTTIRKMRVPRREARPAAPSEHDPVTKTADPGGGVAPALRLTLRSAAPGERARLDGAWWPHSTSLTNELPALITDLHRRGVRVTRVTYHPQAWHTAPRRLDADGRVIRLGWFRSMDPHLLNLTRDGGSARVDLLVVPPDTSEAVAARAMSAATAPSNQATPSASLGALDAPPDTASRVASFAPARVVAATTDIDETAVWDSEGGHARR
jgi:hypothetical protein